MEIAKYLQQAKTSLDAVFPSLFLTLIMSALMPSSALANTDRALEADLQDLAHWARPLNDQGSPFPSVVWDGIPSCKATLWRAKLDPKYAVYRDDHALAHVSQFLAAATKGVATVMETLCSSVRGDPSAGGLLVAAKTEMEQVFQEYAANAQRRVDELEKAATATQRLGMTLGLLIGANRSLTPSQRQTMGVLADQSVQARLQSLTSELALVQGDTAVPGQTVRIPIAPTAGPFRLVVRVMKSTGSCTGAFVGPRLVLTNAHCVSDSQGNPVKNLLVQRDTVVVQETFEVRTWWTALGERGGWRGAVNKDFSDDWAILEIDGDRLDRDKWFRVPATIGASALSATSLMVAGYSGDVSGGRLMTLDTGCPVHTITEATLTFDCSTYKGSSGSPVLPTHDMRVLVGLNACLSGSIDPTVTANARGRRCAVRVERFAPKLHELLRRSGAHQPVAYLTAAEMMTSIKGDAMRRANSINLPNWSK